MNSIDEKPSLLERVALYRSFDEARHAEIEAFAEEYEQMKKAILTLQADLDDERQSRRRWRQRAEVSELHLHRSQFALVLIDGDGYIFNNRYLSSASDSGGAQAAHQLHTEVQNYLKVNDLLDGTAEIDVVVNVYASKTGLAKALYDSNMIQSHTKFDQFIWSFNQSNSLFQFIDCGPGKERVDAKLRDTYRFYAYNAHCKHIFLACCHDNGYVAELDKYRHDKIAAPKTLFVRHEHTARQYASLPFPVARLGSVFETEPLIPTQRIESLHIGTDMSKSNSRDDIPQNGMQGTPIVQTTSYSSVTAGPKTTQPRPADTVTSSMSATSENGLKTNTDSRGIPVNRLGQRLDRRIQPPTMAEIDRFESRIVNQKLCNVHHLTDAGCFTYHCRFDHSSIDPSMKQTLRYKAHSIPCGQGAKCRKGDCFFGHQCPWGNANCANSKCAFYKNGLHDINDLEIAKFVPASAS